MSAADQQTSPTGIVQTSFTKAGGLVITGFDPSGPNPNFATIFKSTNLKDWVPEITLGYGQEGAKMVWTPNATNKDKEFYKVGYSSQPLASVLPASDTITFKEMTALEKLNPNKDKATASYNPKEGSTFVGYDMLGTGPNYLKIFSSTDLKNWKQISVTEFDEKGIKLSYAPTDLPKSQFFRAEVTNVK